ncbi:MAG: pilus assembly protein [Candidatus Thiodiazotropha lotti]|nr:pilus assembly protein [Candidatus Thiodiazotropha lotti]
MVEMLVSLPALLLLGLGGWQTALVYDAKTTINYATFEAARVGAVEHAQSSAIRNELGLRLAPLYGGDGSPRKAIAAITRSSLEVRDPRFTKITILNPTVEAFDDFGRDIVDPRTNQTHFGIPNSHLRWRDQAVNSNSGVNIQDANLLKIKTTFGYELKVPLMDRVLPAVMRMFDPQNSNYYNARRIPITSVATVRMQSDAWRDNNNVRAQEEGGGGTPSTGTTGDDTTTDNQDSGSTGNDSNGSNTDTNGNNDSNSDDNADSNASGDQGDNSEEPTDTLECESDATPENDNQGADEDDQSFWGDLWDGVRDGLVQGYEFVKGFWAGIKDQIGDLTELILHPIDTANGLIELGRAFYNDPVGTATMIGEALGEDWSRLVNCGAYDRGRVIGNYASPAFMMKLATKLSRFGSLSRAITETKRDFGCASFSSNTPVWIPSGSKHISELSVGDQVLSRSELNYIDNPQVILKQFNRTVPSYYLLETEFETIKITPEHPVWKQGEGWVEVKNITVDDVIASKDGDVLVLGNSEVKQPLDVHNISVSNTPNYFVGESKLWVHNTICDLSTPDGTRPMSRNDSGDWVDPITERPINLPDMPTGELANFTGRTARPILIEPGTTIYRVAGTTNNPNGAYWTLEKPTTEGQWREDWAVQEDWNQGDRLYEYRVQEGDDLGGFIGGAERQGDLNGGGTQLYIDASNLDVVQVDLPDGW